MLRSMFAGISGLQNHQVKMDIIGNNIANVNTIGFKKSKVSFQDIMSQTISNASAPTETRGGTNPMQAGLGVTIGSIGAIHTAGNLQSTGRMTDIAIEGEGFFILKSGEQEFYSRAGDFTFDRTGYLLNSNGYKVQGFLPVYDEATGREVINRGDITTLGDIKIEIGGPSEAKATENISIGRNLNTQKGVGETVVTPIEIYDINGNPYQVEVRFTKNDIDSWDYAITVTDYEGNAMEMAEEEGQLVFTSAGRLNLEESDINAFTFTNRFGEEVEVNLDFARVTQYASPTTIEADHQDGYANGTLDSVVIDPSGIITGVYTNGVTKALGMLALASFSNPAGLNAVGGNLYQTSSNSGLPSKGAAGVAGRGIFSPGALEMSNVDLSEEFVDMISTQRGFQANSRIISTSDEMLQELANMKR